MEGGRGEDEEGKDGDVYFFFFFFLLGRAQTRGATKEQEQERG